MVNVTSPLANGRYGPGQEVEILLAYSAPVTVIGTPRLRLDLGDTDGYGFFTRTSNSTTNALVFLYVVKEGTVLVMI